MLGIGDSYVLSVGPWVTNSFDLWFKGVKMLDQNPPCGALCARGSAFLRRGALDRGDPGGTPSFILLVITGAGRVQEGGGPNFPGPVAYPEVSPLGQV